MVDLSRGNYEKGKVFFEEGRSLGWFRGMKNFFGFFGFLIFWKIL